MKWLSSRWRWSTSRPELSPLQAGVRSRLADAVNASAGVVLGGFDLHPMLPTRGGQEATNAVRLPVSGLHNLGKSCSRRPSDHLQDLRALVLRPWRAGFGLGAGYSSSYALSGSPTLGVFIAFGASFALLAPFPFLSVSGALRAPCSAIVADFSAVLVSALFMVFILSLRRLGA